MYAQPLEEEDPLIVQARETLGLFEDSLDKLKWSADTFGFGQELSLPTPVAGGPLCDLCCGSTIDITRCSKFTCGHSHQFCAGCEEKVDTCPFCRQAAPGYTPPKEDGPCVAEFVNESNCSTFTTALDFSSSLQVESAADLEELMSIFDEPSSKRNLQAPITPTLPAPITPTLPTPPSPQDNIVPQEKKSQRNSRKHSAQTPIVQRKEKRARTTGPQNQKKNAPVTETNALKKEKETIVSQIGPIKSRRSGNPKDYGNLTDKQICDTPYDTLMSKIASFDESLKERIKERRRQLKNRVHARKAANKREKRQLGLSGENQKLQEESRRLMEENAKLREISAKLEQKHFILDIQKTANDEQVQSLRLQLQSLRVTITQLTAKGAIPKEQAESVMNMGSVSDISVSFCDKESVCSSDSEQKDGCVDESFAWNPTSNNLHTQLAATRL